MGAYRSLFCPGLQFKTPCELFVGEVDNVAEEEGVVKDENARKE